MNGSGNSSSSVAATLTTSPTLSATAANPQTTLLGYPPSPHSYSLSHLTPDQQARIQEDLNDRENQASSLAAAGMVAETVNYNNNNYSRGSHTPPRTSHGLQPPPTLVGMSLQHPGASLPSVSSLPSMHTTEATTTATHYPNTTAPHITNDSGRNSNSNSHTIDGPPIVDNINWNLDAPGHTIGSGIPGLDDIDMDFATLFDSEEQILMALENDAEDEGHHSATAMGPTGVAAAAATTMTTMMSQQPQPAATFSSTPASQAFTAAAATATATTATPSQSAQGE